MKFQSNLFSFLYLATHLTSHTTVAQECSRWTKARCLARVPSIVKDVNEIVAPPVTVDEVVDFVPTVKAYLDLCGDCIFESTKGIICDVIDKAADAVTDKIGLDKDVFDAESCRKEGLIGGIDLPDLPFDLEAKFAGKYDKEQLEYMRPLVDPETAAAELAAFASRIADGDGDGKDDVLVRTVSPAGEVSTMGGCGTDNCIVDVIAQTLALGLKAFGIPSRNALKIGRRLIGKVLDSCEFMQMLKDKLDDLAKAANVIDQAGVIFDIVTDVLGELSWNDLFDAARAGMSFGAALQFAGTTALNIILGGSVYIAKIAALTFDIVNLIRAISSCV